MAMWGNMEVFNPADGDFESYMDRMDQFLTINKVEEQNRVASFITLIGPSAYGTLKKLLVPDSPAAKSYQCLVDTLMSHYLPKKATIAERFKFNKRDQHQNESVGNYVVEIKGMSKTCRFGEFLNDALRDRLVCGLKCEATRQKLLAAGEITFERACDIAVSIELASEQAKILQPMSVGYVKQNNASERRQEKPWVTDRQEQSRTARQSVRRGQENKKGGRQCGRCGRVNVHDISECPAKSWECYACNKIGHTARMCKNRRQGINSVDQEVIQDLCDEMGEHHMAHIAFINKSSNALKIYIKVENVRLLMEIDSGACSTIITNELYERCFANVKLQPGGANLKVVTGQHIKIVGTIFVTVEMNGSKYVLPMIVVNSEVSFIPLFGRNWLDKLIPEWKDNLTQKLDSRGSISNVSEKGSKVVTDFEKGLPGRFPTVFKGIPTESIAMLEAELKVKDQVTPIFHKAYAVPYALLDKVEKELYSMQDAGIIFPVKHSNWASPIVVVPKPNKDIRICVDFKVTLNRVLETEHYPLPCMEDIFATLAGGKVFTVLDLSGAYQQLKLSKASQHYVTINTHLGLFRFTRLTYGIASAPAIFQATMDKILHGLPKVVCYLDDVLISGKNLEECRNNVEKVLVRLEKYKVRINVNKCKFFANSVEYLGHLIDGEGIKPKEDKVQAILKAPEPQNLTQLRSYLGMLNFYGKFIPMLSSYLKPLYRLQEKGEKFVWSDDCCSAFKKSKELMVNHDVLIHFDKEKHIFVSVDASPYGVGAVLSHEIDGVQRPVMFASSTLSCAEKNYAQLEREGLAIIFAVKRFHKYLYGQRFTLITDHQPLQVILNPRKGIPTLAAARLQRWAIILQAYDYNIIYQKGSKNVVADALSRLPLAGSVEVDQDSETINSFSVSDTFPLSWEDVAEHTGMDLVLSKVRELTLRGWPQSVEDVNFKPFFTRRMELSIEGDCVLWGTRVIIPKRLRIEVLKLLHEQHPGIVRMKMLARSICWWPGIDADIEYMISQCEPCQVTQNAKKPDIFTPWPVTQNNWQRVHVDFFQRENHTFLILMDSKSKWAEVYLMNSTTAVSTIQCLRRSFAVFGLPEELVSDNGPPFDSGEFIRFCKANGVTPIKSPPYHPCSNGLAERGVQNVKKGLLKQVLNGSIPGVESMSMQHRLDSFLFSYRNTPCTVTGVTPAEMLLKQKPRTRVSLLKPKFASKVKTNNNDVNMSSDIRKKIFAVGDKVFVRALRGELVNWVPGRILKLVSAVTYLVNVGSRVQFVHADDLRNSSLPEVRHPVIEVIPNKVYPEAEKSEKMEKVSTQEERGETPEVLHEPGGVREEEEQESSKPGVRKEEEQESSKNVILRRSARSRKLPTRMDL